MVAERICFVVWNEKNRWRSSECSIISSPARYRTVLARLPWARHWRPVRGVFCLFETFRGADGPIGPKARNGHGEKWLRSRFEAGNYHATSCIHSQLPTPPRYLSVVGGSELPMSLMSKNTRIVVHTSKLTDSFSKIDSCESVYHLYLYHPV